MPQNNITTSELVALLDSNGWAADGHTDGYGILQDSGEVKTYGHRQRFAKGDRRCTVGGYTVTFYRLVRGQARQFTQLHIRKRDEITKEATS